MKSKKIVFTGPECSGKTTICKSVAERLQIDWVEEYAREYLSKLNRPYEESDLLAIARGQLRKEQTMLAGSGDFLLCDTSLLVIKIWSTVKYGRCHSWIEQQLQHTTPTLYFLCSPNIPWVADPLREHPKKRQELFQIYKKELEIRKKPYILLSGSEVERIEAVMSILSI